MENVKKANSCRVCKGKKLIKVLPFGMSPLANAFLSKDQIDSSEEFYPLDVYFCIDCTFLQLGHIVSPDILFGNYVYVSSTSSVFVNHFIDFASHAIEKFKLDNSSLVIDIGSNDGILLKPFKQKGIKVLGIEPAKHIAKMARKEGVDTVDEFFSVDLAKRIVKEKGHAKLITGTNVFAHINDLDEVLSGVKVLLEEDGLFVTESPYLVDFIEKRYFDLVYHEHLSYWAIEPLRKLFKRFNMVIVDVEKVPVHGGSIRVYAMKDNNKRQVDKQVNDFLSLEKKIKLQDIKTYQNYYLKVLENKRLLIDLLTDLKFQGKKIIGYGAPAKGNTLLNYFKIGPEIIEYIIDDSPLKQSLFTPGTHIPVVSPKVLQEQKADYILILAWNFAPSIMEKYSSFKQSGGKFIIPVPTPKIV